MSTPTINRQRADEAIRRKVVKVMQDLEWTPTELSKESGVDRQCILRFFGGGSLRSDLLACLLKALDMEVV